MLRLPSASGASAIRRPPAAIVMKSFSRMTGLTVWNYRCFQSNQAARLAPLTFLVGANSTGKTSFLALLRAMHQLAVRGEAPDFSASPYDLGSFNDIVNLSENRDLTPDSFGSSLHFVTSSRSNDTMSVSVAFGERGGAPYPYVRKFSNNEVELELIVDPGGISTAHAKTRAGQWRFPIEFWIDDLDFELMPLRFLLFELSEMTPIPSPENKVQKPSSQEMKKVHTFIHNLSRTWTVRDMVFASAPVRSRPKRTYDPIRPSRDSEGEYVPTFLARSSYLPRGGWHQMKQRLEDFGKRLGLFSQIEVKELGDQHGGPFQLQIRRFGASPESRKRNLVDVGYGVNQVLPLLAELLRPDAREIFLLQQPEVHLHPKAQAELGDLFGTIAAEGRQLVVETHSDYLINRVRMDIRDDRSQIEAKDVSILFFESADENVQIHSIKVDESGNVIGAPPSYREFFMDEIEREIGFL